MASLLAQRSKELICAHKEISDVSSQPLMSFEHMQRLTNTFYRQIKTSEETRGLIESTKEKKLDNDNENIVQLTMDTFEEKIDDESGVGEAIVDSFAKEINEEFGWDEVARIKKKVTDEEIENSVAILSGSSNNGVLSKMDLEDQDKHGEHNGSLPGSMSDDDDLCSSSDNMHQCSISNQVQHMKTNGKSCLDMDCERYDKYRESYRNIRASSPDSSSDDDSSPVFSLGSSPDNIHQNSVSNKVYHIKTKGEIDLDDLPPVEELDITLLEEDIQPVGVVSSIVEKSVIIRSLLEMPPLNIESVLFLSPKKPLGKIFDVFGPVIQPFYRVRFNSLQDIEEKKIAVHLNVYFAPKKTDLTKFIFLDQLTKEKGSDASWQDNNEPPEDQLDYSDDEQERAAKMKRRAKTRSRRVDDDDDDDDEVQVVPSKVRHKSRTQDVPVPKVQKDVPPPKVWQDVPNYNLPKQPGSSPSSSNPFRTPYSNASSYSRPSKSRVMTSPYSSDSYDNSSSRLTRNSQPFSPYNVSQQGRALCPPSPISQPPQHLMQQQNSISPPSIFQPHHNSNIHLASPQIPSRSPSSISYNQAHVYVPQPQQQQSFHSQQAFVSQPGLPQMQVMSTFQHGHIFGQVPHTFQPPIRIPQLSQPPPIYALPYPQFSPHGAVYNQNFASHSPNVMPRQLSPTVQWHQGPPPMGYVPLSVNIPTNSPQTACIPQSHGLLNVLPSFSQNFPQNAYQ